MRKTAALVALVGVGALVPVAAVGCNKEGVAPGPARPAAAASGAPASGDSAAAAAPVTSGPLAVPGPAALSCTTDAMCMSHRCNVQYGKCAFPCATDSDCVAGARCVKSAISTCMTKPGP